MREDIIKANTENVHRPLEGVTVTGEAVRGFSPETAELLIEITATAPTVAQSLRDSYAKSTQVAQAIGALGVQPADLQPISVNVYNLYSQPISALPAYNNVPQLGQPAFGMYPAPQAVQAEVQFGSYVTRRTLRMTMREAARAGEIVDAATRAGATVAGAFSFRPSDEATARKAALEAAAKDARAKAETLAVAAGKQLGDPVAISEDIIATNGTYAFLRSAAPFAFGAGAPQVTGDLEYYARVSARYRFQ